MQDKLRRYIKTPRFRVAEGWLAADGQEDRAPARRRRRTGDDEKAKVKAKAKARGKDKEPGEDEEPPPAERPGRAELRRKLKDVRERLQEPAADGREKKKRGPSKWMRAMAILPNRPTLWRRLDSTPAWS